VLGSTEVFARVHEWIDTKTVVKRHSVTVREGALGFPNVRRLSPADAALQRMDRDYGEILRWRCFIPRGDARRL
jgi:hypothetical protein